MKFTFHSEYGRSPLDNYSTDELQAEIERRKREDREKRALDNALKYVEDNRHRAEVTSRYVYGARRIYTIEVGG